MNAQFVAIERGYVEETKALDFKAIATYLRAWANAFDGDYVNNPEYCVVDKIVFVMKDGEETISI